MERSVGVCVLTEGESEKMGRPKALLWIEDESGVPETFLSHIGRELENFSHEKMLSVKKGQDFHLFSFSNCENEYEEAGVLGEILTALEKSESDALLIVPCDMPYFTKENAAYMMACFEKEDALFVKSKRGLLPCCGIYKKECVPALKKMIVEKDYDLLHLSQNGISIREMKAEEDSAYKQIETNEDYEELAVIFPGIEEYH